MYPSLGIDNRTSDDLVRTCLFIQSLSTFTSFYDQSLSIASKELLPIPEFSSPGFGSFNQIMSILVKDKFLFSAATLPREVEGATLTNQQLTEVLKVSVSFMAGGQNKNGRLVKS